MSVERTHAAACVFPKCPCHPDRCQRLGESARVAALEAENTALTERTRQAEQEAVALRDEWFAKEAQLAAAREALTAAERELELNGLVASLKRVRALAGSSGTPPGEASTKTVDAPEAGPTCMVMDESGNAFDAFPYTAEALRAKADTLDGTTNVYFGPAVSPGRGETQ